MEDDERLRGAGQRDVELPQALRPRGRQRRFDHVIVVEPALTAARPQGLRELYVALTRPTKTLVVLHARPLPAELRAK